MDIWTDLARSGSCVSHFVVRCVGGGGGGECLHQVGWGLPVTKDRSTSQGL